MLNRLLTKENLLNHLRYGKWVYILLLLCCWFAGDLLFTMTEYRPPAERKVDFEFVTTGYFDADALSPLRDRVLAAGRGFDPRLESVNFYAFTYSGDAETDLYGAPKFIVTIASREGDVFVLSRALMTDLAAQGALLPLETYVERGLLRTDGMDLSASTLPAYVPESDDADAPSEPSGETCLYGVPMPDLAAYGYADEPLYGVVMYYSKNPATSAVALQSLIDGTREAGS